MTVFNSNTPRWHSGCARAFVLPLTHPSSLVHLGVIDDDFNTGLKLDDPLGRVIISLAGA